MRSSMPTRKLQGKAPDVEPVERFPLGFHLSLEATAGFGPGKKTALTLYVMAGLEVGASFPSKVLRRPRPSVACDRNPGSGTSSS